LAPYSHEKGDHYVTFKLKVPKKISDKQAELYKQLAELENEGNQPVEAKKNVDKVQTEEAKPETQKKKEPEDVENDKQEQKGNCTFENLFGKIKNPWAN